MMSALELASAQKGRTGDNPSVGCVLVKDGRVIGRAATADGGRPHGEVQALNDCAENGQDPAGCTAYVTLEPCSHIGRSGPCCQALIDAKISRCFIAVIDPNPAVNWQGAAKLQEAGIDTVIGLCEERAREVMSTFFRQYTTSSAGSHRARTET